ncbi:MAG: uroporphyrinogen-III C-methyltransferase [Caldiserica bacterium]|nr:uroporphyrinogen-III C-methyltransferase [Caldisericota bacterium]
MAKGKVYLVGAGPGDPGLITWKGLKILQQAEVVIYDGLVGRAILQYADAGAEQICADELLEGEKGNRDYAKRQDRINQLMIERAKEGKRVVRLKSGDPFIFGRAVEEMEALAKNRIEFSVIPGVTAANAAACFTGIPLTARGISSTVLFATGHEAPRKEGGYVNWEEVARVDTIVLYMAVENLSSIAEKLILCGRKPETPVAVISRVSEIGQKLVVDSLGGVYKKATAENISAPAIVIIGEVVKKEKSFNWFRKSRKVLFTGISSERFFEKGIIFHLPLIEIRPLEDYGEMDDLINRVESFDWIVFSSRFGVLYFFRELFKMGLDARALKGIKIAAIGSSTAGKLREYGIAADLIPERESAKGLIMEFKKRGIKGASILLPRSDIADKGLTEGLRNLSARVYPCVAYHNVMPDNLPDLDFEFFDEIIFTSPSTVRNFIKRYGKPAKKIKIRTIGPVTRREAEKWNLLA